MRPYGKIIEPEEIELDPDVCPVCGSSRGTNIYCWHCRAPLKPWTYEERLLILEKLIQSSLDGIKPGVGYGESE